MKQHFGELTREGIFDCPEPTDAQDDLNSWVISHAKGAWRASAAAADDLSGPCQFVHEMDLHVPDSLTGDASRGVPWPSDTALVPEVQDYVVSPEGNFVVAMVSEKTWERKLVAYDITGTPRRKLWERPIISLRIVMARWGDGRDARRWSGLLRGRAVSPTGSAPVETPHTLRRTP
jgi:hypothetical protein